MNTFVEALANLYVIVTQFNLCAILFRVFLAMLVGGLIGSERSRHGRAAGVRTHTLVCLGSTITVMVGLYSVQVLGLGGDPLRVKSGISTHVGIHVGISTTESSDDFLAQFRKIDYVVVAIPVK